MKRYSITYSFEGYKTVEVEAQSRKAAIALADTIANETDCGELENVDMERLDDTIEEV